MKVMRVVQFVLLCILDISVSFRILLDRKNTITDKTPYCKHISHRPSQYDHHHITLNRKYRIGKEERVPSQMHTIDKNSDNSFQDLLFELHEIVPEGKF